MSERVLFVDDDPHLLASCAASFRNHFPLDTAEGGDAGLEKLAERGPFAVVVSDMQMPGMDGIQFLAAVQERAPDTVRVMLTGNADLEVAIRVVNESNIFRFLTKPCAPETLAKAIDDARAQHRLVTAERELLNKTLDGSIKLLTDILALTDTSAFGGGEKLRPLIAEITQKLAVPDAWEIHLAAMLAAIGYVTLPSETAAKARAGRILSKVEEQMVAGLPETAARLLANIPRLEGVAQIVRYQHKRYDGAGFSPDAVREGAIPFGARLLKILNDVGQLQAAGALPLTALDELQRRQGWYDPDLLAAVRAAFGGAPAEAQTRPVIAVAVKDLLLGMVLRSDVLTREGTLVLAAGHELNDMALEKIQNFAGLSGVREPIFVDEMPMLAVDDHRGVR